MPSFVKMHTKKIKHLGMIFFLSSDIYQIIGWLLIDWLVRDIIWTECYFSRLMNCFDSQMLINSSWEIKVDFILARYFTFESSIVVSFTKYFICPYKTSFLFGSQTDSCWKTEAQNNPLHCSGSMDVYWHLFKIVAAIFFIFISTTHNLLLIYSVTKSFWTLVLIFLRITIFKE